MPLIAAFCWGDSFEELACPDELPVEEGLACLCLPLPLPLPDAWLGDGLPCVA